MSFGLDSIFIYIAGLFFLYIICWIFIKPLKWLLRLLFSCILGAAALAVFNRLGSGFGLHLAINPLTAMTAGVLGAPGAALMLILSAFL